MSQIPCRNTLWKGIPLRKFEHTIALFLPMLKLKEITEKMRNMVQVFFHLEKADKTKVYFSSSERNVIAKLSS